MLNAEDNLGKSVGDAGPLDSNVLNSNDDYSTHQPSMDESSTSNAATEISANAPGNGSGSTVEIEVSSGDNNSNIWNIDLSACAVNGFDNGHVTDQEIGPFYDAISDLDKSLVDNDNTYV